MNKQKGFIPILIILLIVAAIGGYLIYSGKINLSQKQVAQTLKSDASSVLVGDAETVNWKMYTNTQYGYSIKYPDNWYIKDMTKILNSPQILNSQYFNNLEQVDFKNYTVHLTLDSIISMEEVKRKGGGDAGMAYSADIKTEQLYGREIVKSERTNSAVDEKGEWEVTNKSYGVYIPVGQNVLILNGDIKYKAVIEKILSTFNFLDQGQIQIEVISTPTPDPFARWSSYQDIKYPFYFKYPNDWLISVKDVADDNQRIISLAKKDTPTTISLSFSILPNWDNTGNAKDLIKNIIIGGEQGVRVDPPTKSEANLERYQTSFYVEHSRKVYFFGCVHNWNQDYLYTCNSIIKTVTFSR